MSNRALDLNEQKKPYDRSFGRIVHTVTFNEQSLGMNFQMVVGVMLDRLLLVNLTDGVCR